MTRKTIRIVTIALINAVELDNILQEELGYDTLFTKDEFPWSIEQPVIIINHILTFTHSSTGQNKERHTKHI